MQTFPFLFIMFTSSNQSTSNTNLLCIKTSSNYNRTLNLSSPLNAAEYFFKDISCYELHSSPILFRLPASFKLQLCMNKVCILAKWRRKMTADLDLLCF